MYPNSYGNEQEEYVSYNRAEAEPVKTDPNLIEMLHDGINDEKDRAEEYKALAGEMTDIEDKESIRRMLMDSLGHIKLLEQVLFNVTGADDAPHIFRDIADKMPKNPHYGMIERLDNIMFEELEDVVFYRKLYISFLNIEIRDIMFEVITNKQSNGTKLMHICAKHRSR